MGTDLHYVPGEFYRICDRTGFATRAPATKKEWTGLYVKKEVWEIRQPQDFVKGVIDDQTVPDPRSRSIDTFIGPLCTNIAIQGRPGDTTLNVNSSIRFVALDKIIVVTDTVSLYTSVVSTPSATQITIANPLPYFASVGNEITDRTAIAKANIG
jgi:hypothetical protein